MVSRRFSAGLVLVIVWTLVAAGVTAPVAGLQSTGSAAQEAPQPPTVDNTVTRIELAPDGTARWTVTIRTRLDDAAAVEAYGTFQERFRSNTTRFLGPFESRIRSVVAAAAEATGREMSAADFRAETHVQEVPRRWGIVSYTFTWRGFAQVEGDAVVSGDAFAGGFFLAANDTLTVVAPAEYTITRVEPQPGARTDRTVSWTGRVDFPGGRPLVRAAPAGDAAGDGALDVVRPADGPLLVGAGGLALALLVGLAVLARRRGGETGDGAGTGAPTDDPLTDEERVIELLEERGGRVPQAVVVEAFDWSTSKTSRVLGRMADAGTIEKLRLGRENLIRLPGDGDEP